MAALHPHPLERIVDPQGRPYFLWDMDMTLAEFMAALRVDSDARLPLLGKLLREARPDDVFHFISLQQLADELPGIAPFLGRQRAMWEWLVEEWRRLGHVRP